MGGLSGWGQGQNSSFLEFADVAYQIKGNIPYSNMLVNILPEDTPLTPRVGVKGQNVFFKVVMLHIWSVKQHRSQYSVLKYTLNPWDGVKR